MSGEWRRWCRELRVALDGDEVVVTFEGGRTHCVQVVEEADGSVVLRAIVAKARVLDGMDDVAKRVWSRNRRTQLVAFRFDKRDRLIAEAWLPDAGLTREEFGEYVHAVASEADRFEFELTGRDVE